MKPTIDNLLAGDEAMGNDKGYELSTHEKQAEFAKKRNQEEYIKFLEDRLRHSDEQLEKAMEMLAKLMSKMPK